MASKVNGETTSPSLSMAVRNRTLNSRNESGGSNVAATVKGKSAGYLEEIS